MERSNQLSTILVISHNRRNLELLVRLLRREGYRTVAASDLEEVDQALDEAADLRLAVVDLDGFGRRLWSRFERFQEMDLPFLVVAGQRSASIQQKSLSSGAKGMLTKPLVQREFVNLVSSMMKAVR